MMDRVAYVIKDSSGASGGLTQSLVKAVCSLVEAKLPEDDCLVWYRVLSGWWAWYRSFMRMH